MKKLILAVTLLLATNAVVGGDNLFNPKKEEKKIIGGVVTHNSNFDDLAKRFTAIVNHKDFKYKGIGKPFDPQNALDLAKEQLSNCSEEERQNFAYEILFKNLKKLAQDYPELDILFKNA